MKLSRGRAGTFSGNWLRHLCWLVGIGFMILFAWQCDDAYHSHVMSRNLVEGSGFVYNAGERVCASTCPLHTLIVAGVYRLFGNMYWSGLFCNIAESALAVFLLLRFYRNDKYAVIFLTLAIICNKAFIMYTTSGLENSLLFLLFALVLGRFWKCETFEAKHLFELSFLAGLIATTRMDAALMVFPMLFFAWLRRDRKTENAGGGVSFRLCS